MSVCARVYFFICQVHILLTYKDISNIPAVEPEVDVDAMMPRTLNDAHTSSAYPHAENPRHTLVYSVTMKTPEIHKRLTRNTLTGPL